MNFISKSKEDRNLVKCLSVRFGLFLTICLITCLSAVPVYAQNEKVTLQVNNLPIEEVLDQIEKQTPYSFLYSKKLIDVTRKVSVSVKQLPIRETLDKLFADQGITYVINKDQIVLNAKKPETASSQKKTVSGTVTDKRTKESIIGANILIKGTGEGVATNIDGHFSLSVPEDAVLQISFIGYNTVEIPVAGKETIAVILQEDSQSLDEVVVVGYGVQKKVNLTGAVETINDKAIENRPLKSVTDALQGTVSGLAVSSGTGEPGNFATYKIRGNTSVNSGGALVIIDGMPSELNRVNPQDIESMSILKDAASAAIYGARAAEGVILVTTKQGNSEKIKIEYSGNFSFNTPTRLPESNSGLDHALLSNEAFRNAGLAVQFPEDAIAAIKDPSVSALPKGNDWIYTSDTDWISMMMDHSFQETHNLTISKASNGLKYLFSAGWLDQNGMFSDYGPDNFDRINLRSNIGVDIIKNKLNLDSKISFIKINKQNHPDFSGWTIPYITFIQAGPNMPVYDPNGNYARNRMQLNPVQAMREGGTRTEKRQNIEGVFTLAYKPLKGLTLKAVGGAVIANTQKKEWRREYGKYGPNGLISMANGQRGPNSINQSSTHNQYLTSQLLAEYNGKFGNHEFNLLAGWATEENKYEDLSAKRINIVGNELPALGLGATEGWTNGADEYDWTLLSAFMRFNYAYQSKYLLEVNFRADGSSRFSDENKWGIFPSASVGWRMTEEAFMKEQQIFANLKLRASWGRLGNQNGLGNYDHIPQYVVADAYYPFKDKLGQWATITKLPSESRTWETVEMSNFAVDMGFFDNRLTFTGEYFIKRNKDMLVDIDLPEVIGIAVPTGNYGELEVKGWDLSLGWSDKVKDFNYSVRFNMSDQKDKLVNYGVKYNGFVAGVNKKVQGYSLGAIFGYQTDGFFTSEEEVKNSAVFNRSVTGVGDIKYVDQDKDTKISAPNDLKYLGTTIPRYTFGLNMSASWKNIDFSMLLQGVGKRNFYLSDAVVSPFADTWGNYSYKSHNDYWTPENTGAYLPRPYAGARHNYQTSDHWLQNAAYLRMKNLQVGYTLSKALTRSVGIEQVRVYFSGENLCEYSKLYKDYDPELSDVNGYMYPIMRSFSFGLNVTF